MAKNYNVHYTGGDCAGVNLSEKEAMNLATELEGKGYKVIVEKTKKNSVSECYYTTDDIYESDTAEYCFILSMSLETKLIKMIEKAQKKKGYVNTQSKGKHTPIVTLEIYNENEAAPTFVVGVKVVDEELMIAVDEGYHTFTKKDYEDDINWRNIHNDCNPYYETLFAIAKEIEEYIGGKIIY